MKKILILGGGFGGVYCARTLQKFNLELFEVELISNNNYFGEYLPRTFKKLNLEENN